MFARSLALGQRCEIVVHHLEHGPRLVHATDAVLLEAPNWTADDVLVLNGDGVLWTMPADGATRPRRVEIADLPELNNDHLLHPDGVSALLSANDWHVYRAPLAGGRAHRLTADDGLFHFLHGVSPDGGTLLFVGWEDGAVGWRGVPNVWAVGAAGGDLRPLTSADRPSDGCEFGPGGDVVLLNTEVFTQAPGHAQIARMRPDGSDLERLTHGDRVDWFPHVAPDGRHTYYLSYPPGTQGHPADLPVEIRLVHDDDWSDPVTVAELPGGQGTMNVPAWSPDGTAFADVRYPTAGA